MTELAYNLESFNPAFTSVLLRVQQTIGVSDYVRRDTALKHLIQPLAGEYGMHNSEAQGELLPWLLRWQQGGWSNSTQGCPAPLHWPPSLPSFLTLPTLFAGRRPFPLHSRHPPRAVLPVLRRPDA
jgi:hypothetical protein